MHAHRFPLILAAIGLLAGTAFAANVGGPSPNMTVNPNAVRGFISVGCAVQGTPVEFPDDIRLTNKGNMPIAAGTRIQWSMTGPNHSGIHKLTSALAPGGSVFLSHAFGGGVEAGHPCSAKAI
ncbi:MAG: hypothetical protein U1E56_02200 [Bauldia sp.]